MSQSRRRTLKVVGATLGAAAFAKAMEPLQDWEDGMDVDAFLQRHYRELSPDALQQVLRRLEADARTKYGREVTIEDVKPTPGVEFGYALNLSLCIG